MARFKPGDTVRVRVGIPPTHMRTPAYIQSKKGRIVKIHGAFKNPESLAYGGDGLPKQVLYLVRFAQPQLWQSYGEAAHDQLFVDVYEHWLESA